MTKFSGTQSRPMRANVASPLRTTDRQLPTYEGGDGYEKTAETELFQLAVTNMVGENTFYESAENRDSRFVQLIHQVARGNPEFFLPKEDGRVGFVKFLRDTMNMRSASIVAAAEYAAAGGPNARQIINDALVRGDEPGEFLGYWLSRHGRAMGGARKRGLADAVTRIYNEFSLLKYDGQSKGVRFADVIEFAHPKAKDDWQDKLFKYAIDRRHNRDELDVKGLPKISADLKLQQTQPDKRRALLGSKLFETAGWNWERLSGWLPGGMDAEAWEAVIPDMGYMAMIRNLRNFEQAGVARNVLSAIATDIADPEQVAKSRQFPYRFWSAYKANDSLTFVSALEAALDASTQNIPELPGRTLVLIDTSGSMDAAVSDKSKVMRWEVGALFAAALSKKAQSADTVLYATNSEKHNIGKSTSVLRYIESVQKHLGRVGHGTNTWQAVADNYNGHDRVVIFTDGQTADQRSDSNKVPLHVFDLSGYRTAMAPSGRNGYYSYGGFTDATFTIMKLVEEGRSSDWPF